MFEDNSFLQRSKKEIGDQFSSDFFAPNLIRQYGSPLFIISEKILKQKYFELESALKDYRHFKIAYSFKTNYIPGICKIFKESGAAAEVVSGFEYWLAKKLGYAGRDIIFNGPYKKDSELLDAICDGCILNADNYFELARLEKIVESKRLTQRIGLRVNMHYSRPGSSPWNRFGFNIENGEAVAICSKIKSEFKNLNVVGLHMHLGTNISDVRIYKAAMLKVLNFMIEIRKKFEIKIDYIDVGGGFAIYGNRLKNVAEESVPSATDYTGAIIQQIIKKLDYKPLLIFEPGRFLVANAATLLTRVISTKKIDNNPTTTVDSSISILREAPFIDFKILAIKQSDVLVPTIIFGSSCTQSDILGKGNLPSLEIGDILAIYDVGAYSLPRSSQWIYPRPAVILKNDSRVPEFTAIRRGEGYEDLVCLDLF